MSEAAGPLWRVGDGVTVALRVAPGSARATIGETVADANGARMIKVSVTAAPEGGKANDAVIRLLAKAWRIPKTSLSIVSGAAGRRKTILASGDSEDLFQRLSAWMESRDG